MMLRKPSWRELVEEARFVVLTEVIREGRGWPCVQVVCKFT